MPVNKSFQLSLIAVYNLLVFLFVINTIPYSFDGHFNLEAISNLVEYGVFKPDFLPTKFVQTGIVFQILVLLTQLSCFLKAFSLHIINFIFIFLFSYCYLKITEKSDVIISTLSYLSLITSLLFIECAFSGYGELPSFSLILYALLLFKRNLSKWGTIILGIALSFKIISFIFVIPIFLYLRKLNKNPSYLIYSILISLTILFVQIFLGDGDFNLFNQILNQTIPQNIESNYSKIVDNIPSYFVGLFERVESFSIPNDFQFLFRLLLIAISLFLILKKDLNPILYFILISIIVITLWFIFFSSRPWIRRYFYAELLLYISVPLICDYFKSKNLSRMFCAYLLALTIGNTFGIFSQYYNKQLKLSNIDIDANHSIHSLDKKSNFFYLGYWNVPWWRTYGVQPEDLFTSTINFNVKNYLLLDKHALGSQDYKIYFSNEYITSYVYQDIHKSILKIIDLNSKGKFYQSLPVYPRSRNSNRIENYKDYFPYNRGLLSSNISQFYIRVPKNLRSISITSNSCRQPALLTFRTRNNKIIKYLRTNLLKKSIIPLPRIRSSVVKLLISKTSGNKCVHVVKSIRKVGLKNRA